MALLFVVLSVAMNGGVLAFLQVVGHFQTGAGQLNHALSLSAQLTETIPAHQALASALWNDVPVNPHLYQQQQDQIVRLFAEGLRDLHEPGQQDLLRKASQDWRVVLSSRGLWAPWAAAWPEVTPAQQQLFAQKSDEVFSSLGELSNVSVADGAHDLAVANSLQRVVVGLLLGMFTAVVGVLLYVARRMTTNVVRPIEVLQRAAVQLRDGDLEHRVAIAPQRSANEVTELADAFNAMASALD